jgi:tol-pal system protein YbgF
MLILLATGPAYSQNREILQLQADMIRLSQQVNQLQGAVDAKNAVIQGLLEKVVDQVNGLVSGLSTNLQRINQTIEAVKEGNDKTAAELRVAVEGIDKDVEALTEGLTTVKSQISSVSQQITAMKTTSEPLPTLEDLRRTAVTDYLVGNYDLSIAGFQEFLTKFPNDPQAHEAQLYIGDAYYNQKKYEQALLEYDLFLQKYPGSDKSRTALYKKGLALAELDQRPQAITTLRKVIADFPNTVEATNANQKIRELNAPARR